jgi:hypothetical protein
MLLSTVRLRSRCLMTARNLPIPTCTIWCGMLLFGSVNFNLFVHKTRVLSRLASKYMIKFVENLFLLWNSSTKQRKSLKIASYRIYYGRLIFIRVRRFLSSSFWSRGLRCGSVATRLLGLRVRIPPETWMSVAFECSVLSCRGLCDGPITRL